MSAHPSATVFVVDDDDAFRDSLGWLLTSAGHRVELFRSADRFLAGYDPQQPGCIVLDIRMPGMNGLELQDELKRRAHGIPIIFVTGHGDVPMAVSAVKKGAAEFIEKPFNDEALIGLVEKALKLDASQRREHARRMTVAARIEKLTSREREIMQFIIAGKMNKTMADELRISIKTVEAHRAKVMQKMGVDSVAELVQFVIESGHARGGRW
jgi:FixJ family two-component response regulator